MTNNAAKTKTQRRKNEIKKKKLTACVLLVASERLHFLLEIANVEKFAQVVSRRTYEPIAVELVPFQVGTRVFVRMSAQIKLN